MSWNQWKPFTPSAVAKAPEYAGVYHIAADGYRFDYPWGKSSTLYYGKADASIFNRLTRHITGKGSTIVHDFFKAGALLKMRWRPIEWPDDPRGAECELITAHIEQFGEKPLANQRGCRLSTVAQRL